MRRAKARIERDPASFRDPSGFVFYRDGVVYRQVNRAYQEQFDLLIQSNLHERLVESGLLLPHEEADIRLAQSDRAYRVLEPEPLQFVSYPYEWCFSQLRDAALLTLKAQLLALEHGRCERLQRSVPAWPSDSHRHTVVRALRARLALDRLSPILRTLPRSPCFDELSRCTARSAAPALHRRCTHRPGQPAASEANALDAQAALQHSPPREEPTALRRPSCNASEDRNERTAGVTGQPAVGRGEVTIRADNSRLDGLLLGHQLFGNGVRAQERIGGWDDRARRTRHCLGPGRERRGVQSGGGGFRRPHDRYRPRSRCHRARLR